ncbi:hypothetical protein [Streptomyces acidiscabies]|uniref:DUF222 domain-containing protein n=1 Tax=Streptomyces acidiscabies TaxID=42234 RepID=A0ABU4LW48_9ACTN|nr:hypothetical protein [Streptomyces acidiscabies]MDX3019918.1 hypothetical protein [Streptomyces acidiscabies]
MSLHHVIEHALLSYYADSADPGSLVGTVLARYDAECQAEVLRRAADAIEALPQDYECDPGRGDAVERLRRTAAGIEREKSSPRADATPTEADRAYRDGYTTGRTHAGADGWRLAEYTPVFTTSDGTDRPISELRHRSCGGLLQGVGPHSLVDLMALAAQHECQHTPGKDGRR